MLSGSCNWGQIVQVCIQSWEWEDDINVNGLELYNVTYWLQMSSYQYR